MCASCRVAGVCGGLVHFNVLASTRFDLSFLSEASESLCVDGAYIYGTSYDTVHTRQCKIDLCEHFRLRVREVFRLDRSRVLVEGSASASFIFVFFSSRYFMYQRIHEAEDVPPPPPFSRKPFPFLAFSYDYTGQSLFFLEISHHNGGE